MRLSEVEVTEQYHQKIDLAVEQLETAESTVVTDLKEAALWMIVRAYTNYGLL